MSYEQAAGRPIYSSDLYSLGLTAIYLLTGKTPQQLQTNLKTGEFMWRKELPSLHSSLASVIDRAIRFNPRERFMTAEEMLLSLSLDHSTEDNINDIASFSQAQTKAVIGRAHSEVNLPITATGQTFNLANGNQGKLASKQRDFRIPLFLPLVLLPLMAITSFLFGYQLWKQLESSNNSEEVATEQQSTKQVNPPEESDTKIENEDDKTPPSLSTEEPNSSNSSIFREKKDTTDNNNDFNTPEEVEDEIKTLSPIGLSAQELNRKWGKPSYQNFAYDNRVTIFAYNNPFPRIEQVKYLVSNETQEIVQIDLVVSSKIPTNLISRLMNRTFKSQMSNEAKYAIAEVLKGKTDLRSFYLGNEYQGMVQRRNEQVEIRVWDRKFSF